MTVDIFSLQPELLDSPYRKTAPPQNATNTSQSSSLGPSERDTPLRTAQVFCQFLRIFSSIYYILSHLLLVSQLWYEAVVLSFYHKNLQRVLLMAFLHASQGTSVTHCVLFKACNKPAHMTCFSWCIGSSVKDKMCTWFWYLAVSVKALDDLEALVPKTCRDIPVLLFE